jgi:hypothetical protein
VARAEVTRAIDWGARTFPQPETDTWPAARPLVEWLVRMLPPGGSARERRQWTDDELEALRGEFFASTYAQGVDGQDERSLLETILWYATDYGSGDPLRWSNVRVEILLADWLPRKVVADVPFLAKVPALLRRYVQFAHEKVGLRQAVTQDVLDAVDEWEPEYQRLIRSERPQGAAALASAALAGSRDLDLEDVPTGEILLRELDLDVGDRYRLMNLDTSPLPDEPFEWTGIPEDTHERVREVLELCDRCAEEIFDVEHRTAFRRFLGRAAVADPQIFRRRSAANRAAAAVCWSVASANRTVGQFDGGLESGELLAWFGVKGSVSQRAEVFLRANAVDSAYTYGARHLGTPDLLTAARREAIVAARDRYLVWED